MDMQTFNSDKLTAEQREAMRDLQERSGIPWETFLSNATAPTTLCPYVGIHDFHGMFVGIEHDGYTHT